MIAQKQTPFLLFRNSNFIGTIAYQAKLIKMQKEATKFGS